MIYLDNNATTPLSEEVFSAMRAAMAVQFANPSSPHAAGRISRAALDRARRQVSGLINSAADEIVFTSGGTESINAALMGAINPSSKSVLVTSSVEHVAVRAVAGALGDAGTQIIELPVDSDGQLQRQAFEDALEEAAVVSIMWANNETGVLFDVLALASICRQRGVLFHVDAVQAAGKIAIDTQSVPIDLMSISAHKLHGPKGSGALYVREGTPWRPVTLGGAQEENRRGGTENVAAIVGFGVAAQSAAREMDSEMPRIAALRDRLQLEIINTIQGATVNGAGAPRVANTLNVSFGVPSELLLMLLDGEGVCASSGAACSSGAVLPSHVIIAMTGSEQAASSALRFSLSRYTTDNDIEQTLVVLRRVVPKARAAQG